MLSLDRRDAQYEYAQRIHQEFRKLEAELPAQIARRLAETQPTGTDPGDRGAVWTYLTTDQPFGSWTTRLASGLRRKFRT
jgi:preprotein translocase subunit SecA